MGGGVPAHDRALAEADDPVAVDEDGTERFVAVEEPERRVRRHERALQRTERSRRSGRGGRLPRRAASTATGRCSARVGPSAARRPRLGRERRVRCGVGRVPGAAPLLERQRAGHERHDGHRRPRRRRRGEAGGGPGPPDAASPPPRRGSPRGTPARRRSGRSGDPANQSSASSSRAPRYSSPSSRPAPSQLRAASVRWRCSRSPSRSSSSQPRSRGHWRIRASWATSTVGSRLARVAVEAQQAGGAEPVDAPPRAPASSPSSARSTRRRVSSVPSPSVDQAAEQPAHARSLARRRGSRYSSLGPAGQRPGDAAELAVAPPGQHARRPARSYSSVSAYCSSGSAPGWSATSATIVGRPGRARTRTPTACGRLDDRPLQLVGRQRRDGDGRRARSAGRSSA